MIGLYILLLCRVYTYQDIDENYGWPVRQYEDVVILICETNFSGFKRQIQTPLPLLYSKASLFSDIFLNNKVPLQWEKVAYPSLKPLSSWINDLISRIEFMGQWLYNGPPMTYWLPAFFFPQGFMTAALQTYARKT